MHNKTITTSKKKTNNQLIFQLHLSQPVPPQVFLLHLFQKRTSRISEMGVFTGWISTVSVKAMKGTQRTNPDQWTGLILFFIQNWTVPFKLAVRH